MKQTTSFFLWVKAPLSMQVLLVVFTTCITLFFSCQKEALTSDPSLSTTTVKSTQVKNPITAEMAQKWFESNFGKSKVITGGSSSFSANSTDSLQDGQYFWSETLQISPLWSQSQISTYLNTYPIALVPIRPIASLESRGLGYSLVFFRDSLQQLSARLQVYKPLASYSRTHTTLNVRDFSGLFYQIGLDGRVQRVYTIENGRYLGQIFLATNRGSSAGARSCDCEISQRFCLLSCAGIQGVVNDGGSGGYHYTPKLD